jgi:hypothetical protein
MDPNGEITESYHHFSPPPQNQFKWLFQFPKCKNSYFPDLQELRIVDPTPLSPHQVIKWIPSPEFIKEFQAMEIELDVRVCVHLVDEPRWSELLVRAV